MSARRNRTTKFLPLALLPSLTSLAPPGAMDYDGHGLARAIFADGGQVAGSGGIGAPPPVPPLEFEAIGADRARMLNAAVPMGSVGGLVAAPFVSAVQGTGRQRAVDCLASAMWYEAGNDARGQKAVAQVVLNRVRHPAFPASVCGVVFQGSERRTGCQFTFTCDGALSRVPSPAAFAAARLEAAAMLDGEVDRSVGLATHYHTDWVHPVWSAAMDKIARVDTHLFFRWRGKWGQRQAMAQRYSGEEPVVAKLAGISPIHRIALAESDVAITPLEDIGAQAVERVELAPAIPQLRMAPGLARPSLPEGVFQLAGAGNDSAMTALKLCEERTFCKVVGRLSGSAGAAGSPGAVAFLYVRDRRTGVDRVFWDCAAFPRKNPSQCLSGENLSWIDFDGNRQSGGGGRRLANKS